MIINYEDQHLELEEEGRCNLVLVAARYTGEKSSVNVNKYRQQAAWPGHSPFQGGPEKRGAEPNEPGREPGPAQAALIPDWTDEETENRTVEALEADPDIEVLYRPEAIAKAMLQTNYLDPNVFGRGYDAELRDRVLPHLGLEDVGTRNEAQYREQLREIAGIDSKEAQRAQEIRDDSRVTQYRSQHPRSELINAARILGHDRPEDEGKIALATWLADRDAEAVRKAFEGKTKAAQATEAGEDYVSDEPITADEAVEMYEYDELKAVVKKVRQGTGEFSLHGATNEAMAAFLVEDKDFTEDEIDGYLTE